MRGRSPEWLQKQILIWEEAKLSLLSVLASSSSFLPSRNIMQHVWSATVYEEPNRVVTLGKLGEDQLRYHPHISPARPGQVLRKYPDTGMKIHFEGLHIKPGGEQLLIQLDSITNLYHPRLFTYTLRALPLEKAR